MENAKRLSVGNILSLIFLSVLPVLGIVLGVRLAKTGVLLTGSFVFSYFILPILAILLFGLVLFVGKRVWVKVALCMVVLIVALLIFSAFYLFQEHEFINRYVGSDIQAHYVENKNELMPELSELSSSEKLEYYFYEGYGFIFEWESHSLICKYSDEEYSKQKSLLEEKYVFLNDTIKDDEFICQPATEIDGYYFRMLSIAEYEMNYPKEVVLIATNDKTSEIVYISYLDFDIDSISSLDEFILNNCGWEHIDC